MDLWFVHPKLAMDLLDDAAARALLNGLPPAAHPLWRHFHTNAMEHALADAFVKIKPASIVVNHVEGTLEQGQLVWAEQRFYYNGIGTAFSEIKARRPGRARFHAPLATDKAFEVVGDFNAEHLTGDTAFHELSGQARNFVLGYVKDLDEKAVHLRPILIADRWGPGVDRKGLGFIETEPSHVWPGEVDQFDGVDWAMRLKPADLNILRTVAEEQIKEWLAAILGEPTLPKDWGGEQFDLWTDRITLSGKPLRAAFALKGPAKFHPMTIADLGKNGDQISRLANTVADLLVVQHCHTITAPVEHMLRAFAVDPANPRRYMTIDGYNTIRILRHFGYLNQ